MLTVLIGPLQPAAHWMPRQPLIKPKTRALLLALTSGAMFMAVHATLPPTLAPLGLSRTIAAAFVGVSENTFAEMVKDGRMPKPCSVGRRRIWNRLELEAHFAELPKDSEPAEANTWDDVA